MRPLPAATAAALTLALLAPSAPASAQVDDADLPIRRTIKDSRTSPRSVDISRVTLRSSGYFDSTQIIRVTLPGGFRTGQRITAWVDLDGDAGPEGRIDIRMTGVRGQHMVLTQRAWRTGSFGSLGTDVTGRADCGGDQNTLPIADQADVGTDDTTLMLTVDLWACFGFTKPLKFGSKGRWRAVVRVAKGKKFDYAPNRGRWSRPLRGWMDKSPDE